MLDVDIQYNMSTIACLKLEVYGVFSADLDEVKR